MLKIFVIILLLLLPSCTGSIAYISYGKSAADVISFIMTDKTTTEHGMDLITGQDCKFIYVLKEKNLAEVCREKETPESKTFFRKIVDGINDLMRNVSVSDTNTEVDLKKRKIQVGRLYLIGPDAPKL